MVTDKNVSLWYAPASGDRHAEVLLPASDKLTVCRSRWSRAMVDRLVIRGRLPLGRLLGTGKALGAWSPDFTLPPLQAGWKAVTAHDIAWMVAPSYAPRGLRAFLVSVVPRQLATSDRVFAVSESVRIELIDRFPEIMDRVIVAPNGVESRFWEAANVLDRRSLNHLDLPAEYLLMVGTLEPRKNHLRVIEAIMRMNSPLPLVVAGGRGWAEEPIIRAMAAAGPQVKYVGYVPDDLLPQLYANAAAFIAASVYEGFDLPLLEALATGTEVIASDIPVHREIAGNLAHFFDPHSADSIEDGIIGLISGNRGPKNLQEPRAAVLSRYQWHSSADRVWSTIRERL
ncbi:MAG: glycosyltransferase family 4 protein [Thermomicrobiales bacterium]